MKKDDDIALSSLTAAAGNGFCEVALGGLITIPAAFVFLGFSFVQDPPGTFGMGFVALPNVFNEMIGGRLFGFLFFFLLFLAAVTSSLSMLQPAIALLEEGLGLKRKASVALLGFITAMGAVFVVYFSEDLMAMDTIDFWVGTFCIYLLATMQVIMFAWVLGIERGFEELNRGAEIRIPRIVKYIIKYVAPTYLLTIFSFWIYNEFIKTPEDPTKLTRLDQIRENMVVRMSLGFITILVILFLLLIAQSVKRWRMLEASQEEAST
jgi:SNF family Na+-dependent transporter